MALLPPAPLHITVFLWRDDAAAFTHPEGNAGLALQEEILPSAAVTTDAQIFNIVSAPELRDEGQFQRVHPIDRGNLDAYRCGKDRFNTGKKVVAVRIYLIADANGAYSWMGPNFHSVLNCATRLRNAPSSRRNAA